MAQRYNSLSRSVSRLMQALDNAGKALVEPGQGAELHGCLLFYAPTVSRLRIQPRFLMEAEAAHRRSGQRAARTSGARTHGIPYCQWAGWRWQTRARRV